MDLLRPGSCVTSQKLNDDNHSAQREYNIGETVMARNYRDGPKRMEGVVVKHKGPFSHVVLVDHGMFWRHHIEHLRNGSNTVQQTEIEVEVPIGPQPEERESKSKHKRQKTLLRKHTTVMSPVRQKTQRILLEGTLPMCLTPT